MIKVSMDFLKRNKLVSRLYGRVLFQGNFCYVPDVVAQRYSINGERLGKRDAIDLARENWDKMTPLQRRYCLSERSEFGLALMFC